ncbi:hypothetical protein Tco_0884022 [Tanacetum coccineum]
MDISCSIRMWWPQKEMNLKPTFPGVHLLMGMYTFTILPHVVSLYISLQYTNDTNMELFMSYRLAQFGVDIYSGSCKGSKLDHLTMKRMQLTAYAIMKYNDCYKGFAITSLMDNVVDFLLAAVGGRVFSSLISCSSQRWLMWLQLMLIPGLDFSGYQKSVEFPEKNIKEKVDELEKTYEWALMSDTMKGEMDDYMYWKAEEKEAIKQCLLELAKDHKKQLASMPRLNLFKDQSYDDSFYIDEENFEALYYEDAHLGMSFEKSPKFHF